MRPIIIVLSLISFLVLSAFGQKTLTEPITLLNHEQKEVTFPLEKPTVFFFITTYTWRLCQKQLVQLHKNINKFDGMDIEMFVISSDSPEELLSLHNKLEETSGHSLSFISDPKLELIDKMGMKKDGVAYRGYGMIDKKGNIIFNTKNDHWGEQIEKTVEKIKEEYNKLK